MHKFTSNIPIIVNNISTMQDVSAQNMDLSGNLDVSGNTTIGRALDVTGNTIIGGTLNVSDSKATSLTGTLDVTGATTLNGGINADNFSVADSTGNTTTGTLTLKSSATTTTSTQIPVFITDPSTTARTLVTRTPEQLRGDIGALSVVDLSVTNGTTSGPVINSSAGTNVTIPSASATISGIVTTGAQTFAGTKTFSNVLNVGGDFIVDGVINQTGASWSLGGFNDGVSVNLPYSSLENIPFSVKHTPEVNCIYNTDGRHIIIQKSGKYLVHFGAMTSNNDTLTEIVLKKNNVNIGRVVARYYSGERPVCSSTLSYFGVGDIIYLYLSSGTMHPLESLRYFNGYLIG